MLISYFKTKTAAQRLLRAFLQQIIELLTVASHKNKMILKHFLFVNSVVHELQDKESWN